MDISAIQSGWKIEKIERYDFPAERPRTAGANARLGVHGKMTDFQCVRVTIDGQCGFGWSRVPKEKAANYLGLQVMDLFDEKGEIKEEYNDLEYPVMDWLGRISNKPVYELVQNSRIKVELPLSTVCYDSTLYFDELHIEDDAEAAEFMQKEALEGVAQGHRAFKIKVGRGGRHMPVVAGMRRDILVVKKIREAVGKDALIMVDANNGYNLNLTKEFLEATADVGLYWLEEPFFEDYILYDDLRKWMQKNNMNILIADGEGVASPRVIDWARDGYIDIIQYDVRYYGFNKWLRLGRMLDSMNVKSAPHNYSGFFGNFSASHLATAIEGFMLSEIDEAKLTGVDYSKYYIDNGRFYVPDAPGFGLELDHEFFAREVARAGWTLTL